MVIQKIPRNEWRSFLETFSRQHENWLVTVERRTSRTDSEIRAKEQPLESIKTELNGDRVSIACGQKSDAGSRHMIEDPVDIRLHQTDVGADLELEVESSDGTVTIVRFRSALLPEMVDGI